MKTEPRPIDLHVDFPSTHSCMGSQGIDAPFFVIDGEPVWGEHRRARVECRLANGPF